MMRRDDATHHIRQDGRGSPKVGEKFILKIDFVGSGIKFVESFRNQHVTNTHKTKNNGFLLLSLLTF
jgi:hypothetical protein